MYSEKDKIRTACGSFWHSGWYSHKLLGTRDVFPLARYIQNWELAYDAVLNSEPRISTLSGCKSRSTGVPYAGAIESFMQIPACSGTDQVRWWRNKVPSASATFSWDLSNNHQRIHSYEFWEEMGKRIRLSSRYIIYFISYIWYIWSPLSNLKS